MYLLRLERGTWLPRRGDRREYEIRYRVVDAALANAPEEEFNTRTGALRVWISGRLEAMWRVPDESLERILYEFGRRELIHRLSRGVLGENEELALTSSTAPDRCPFDPARIELTFGVAIAVEPTATTLSLTDAARDIITRRDVINVITRVEFGFPLLTLPSERQLLELFLSCETREDFAYRVASLAALAVSFDLSGLRRHVKCPDGAKSIECLDLFLQARLSGAGEPVIASLRHLNRLRQMYPIHVDHASGVLQAHQALGLGYPVEDFGSAWSTLLGRYGMILHDLFALLSPEL